jgi:alkylhydroperoxidase/carboxymuconolactone decarboxylase family protein YurZ
MKKNVKEIVKAIENKSGAVRSWRKILAELDPELVELQNQTYTYIFEKKNALPRKYKEIIVCCLDSATAFEPGFRMHVRKALLEGATVAEILEALEICSYFNQHNLTEFLPALMEEAEKVKKEHSKVKRQSK